MKGNFLNKTLSMVLVIAMLLSCLMVCQPAFGTVVTDSPITFDNWTDVGADYAAAEWRVDNAADVIGNAALVDAGEEHAKALQLPSDGKSTKVFGYKVGATSGQYEIKFSLYPKEDGNFNVWIGDNVNAGLDSCGVVHFYNGEVYSTKDLTTNANMYLCRYTTEKWYDITVNVDLDSRLYRVVVSDDEGNTLGTRTMTMAEDDTLSNIYMNTREEGVCYVDDISVKESAEKLTVIVDDDFESYTQSAAGSSADEYNSAYLANNWWVFDGVTGRILPVVYSTTFQDNKVLRFGDASNAGLLWKFSNPIKSGRVKMSGSVNMSVEGTSGSVVCMSLRTSDNGENDHRLMLAHNGSIFGLRNTHNTGFGLGTWSMLDTEPNVWYDFIITLDMDSKTQSIQLFRDGKTVGLKRDIPFHTNASELSSIHIKSLAKNAPWYLDNWKVEIIDDAETVDDYLIFDEDFSKSDTTDDLKKNGWDLTASTDATDNIVTDGAEKYLVVGPKGKVQRAFSDDISENSDISAETPTAASTGNGKYRFSFDVKTSGKALISYIGQYDPESTGDKKSGSVNLAFLTGGAIYHTASSAHNNRKLADYNTEQWVNIEVEVDVKNKKEKWTARDMSGNILGSPVEKEGLYDASVAQLADGSRPIIGMKALSVHNWDTSLPLYIDNVKIEYAYSQPSLNNASVTMTDINDNKIEDILNDVTPGLKKIELDFGANMTEDGLAGKVSLMKGETPVTFEGKTEGTKYIMTLPDMLEEKSNYILTVDKSASNSVGATIGNSNFVLTFNTTNGYVTASKPTVWVDANTEVTGLSGLAENQSIKVKSNVVNCTSESSDITVIAAFYDGNRLISATPYPGTINRGDSSFEKEITLPNMEEVTSVKI